MYWNIENIVMVVIKHSEMNQMLLLLLRGRGNSIERKSLKINNNQLEAMLLQTFSV